MLQSYSSLIPCNAGTIKVWWQVKSNRVPIIPFASLGLDASQQTGATSHPGCGAGIHDAGPQGLLQGLDRRSEADTAQPNAAKRHATLPVNILWGTVLDALMALLEC